MKFNLKIPEGLLNISNRLVLESMAYVFFQRNGVSESDLLIVKTEMKKCVDCDELCLKISEWCGQ